MKEDEEGFLYPEIDEAKCSDCGLCVKTCSFVQKGTINSYANQKSYLAYGAPKHFYENSATIGICSKLSYETILNHGYVVGVLLDNKTWKPQHKIVSNLEALEKLKNSKYAQSEIQTTYQETKRLLQEKQNVLFIGTPCQIAGLKAFLRKEYETLTTIDVICHGVFSYRLLRREVQYWENVYKGKITSFKFRSKKYYPWSMGGVINFDVVLNNKRLKHVEKHARLSMTYRCFAYSGDGKYYNLRPSCYDCHYREKGRYGDLTVGDAWGISQIYPDVFSVKNCWNGISLVFANTEKGADLVKNLDDFCFWREIPLNHAFSQPALLSEKMIIPKERKIIYNDSNDIDYRSIVERVLNVDFNKLKRKEIIILIKRLLLRPTKNILKVLSGKQPGQWI